MMSRRTTPGALVLLTLLGTAACKDKGTEPPPSPAAIQKLSADPATGTVGQALGEALTLKVVTTDGAPVPDVAVAWSVTLGGGSVSAAGTTTDASGETSVTWTLGTTTGTQQVTATVTGITPAIFSATATADVASTLAVAPVDLTFAALQDTATIDLTAEDGFGNQLPDTAVSWASLDEGVAVPVAGDRIASVGVGATSIIITADALADTIPVEVYQAIADVTLTPDSVTFLAADTVTLAVAVTDSNGVALSPAASVVWASSDTAVATVDATGLVTGIDPGLAVISAEATGTHNTVAGSASIVVVSENAPVVNSVSPDTMAPGDTITITGANFAATPGGNTVMIRGVATTVLTASLTELTAVVPDRSSFDCVSVGPAQVSVSVSASAGTRDHPLRVAIPHAMAAGESYRALDVADVACHEIVGPGDFAIGVFNVSTTPSATSAFEVRGAVPAASADLARAVTPLSRPAVVRRGTPLNSDGTDPAGHMEILEMNRRLVRELGMPRFQPRSTPGASVPLANTASVGDTLTFRVPDVDASNSCSSFITVGGRVVYVGTRIVMVEDTAGPQAGTMDAVYASVGAEFDTLMFNVLTDNFGDPLALDDSLDNNDRLIAVFSKTVNDFDRGVAGFVFSGDFYDNIQCASSDHAEVFYGRIATDAPGGSNDADTWRWRMRSTIIHESKHLTAYANRFPDFETSWLEESTARMSEELYARQIFGYGQGDNVKYADSIYCEYRPSWAECMPLDPAVIMGKHFGGLYSWLENVEDFTPLKSDTDDQASFYGSGWSLVRWVIDATGQDEATFLKALISDNTRTGVENLADKAGMSFADMLTDWGMTWVVDDRNVAPDRTEVTFPGWDIRDIFEGLNTDFSSSYPMAYPLVPHVLSGGTFTESISSLRAGTGAYFEFSGTANGNQLLELQGAGGGAPPITLRLAIVRIL